MVIDLHTRDTHSLKEKRKIVLSVKEKLKQKYNISIIESGNQDLWQEIQFAVAMVANTKAMLDKVFEQVEDFIFSNYPVQIVSVHRDYM